MIDKMQIINWELQQSDSGNFRVNLNLLKVKNQFGNDWDNEKMFRELIQDDNAYYKGGDEPFISTNYASSKQTLESVKGILKTICHLNDWIDDENYIRAMDMDMLRKRLTRKLYPVPEKEG